MPNFIKSLFIIYYHDHILFGLWPIDTVRGLLIFEKIAFLEYALLCQNEEFSYTLPNIARLNLLCYHVDFYIHLLMRLFFFSCCFCQILVLGLCYPGEMNWKALQAALRSEMLFRALGIRLFHSSIFLGWIFSKLLSFSLLVVYLSFHSFFDSFPTKSCFTEIFKAIAESYIICKLM